MPLVLLLLRAVPLPSAVLNKCQIGQKQERRNGRVVDRNQKKETTSTTAHPIDNREAPGVGRRNHRTTRTERRQQGRTRAVMRNARYPVLVWCGEQTGTRGRFPSAMMIAVMSLLCVRRSIQNTRRNQKIGVGGTVTRYWRREEIQKKPQRD